MSNKPYVKDGGRKGARRAASASSWESKGVEVYFSDEPKEASALRLEEVARALYEYSCQLAKRGPAFETTEAMTPELRRTGTDG